MRRRTSTVLALGLVAVTATLGGCAASGSAPTAPQLQTAKLDACGQGTRSLSTDLKSHSRWELCWSIDKQAGLTLSDIVFVDATGERTPVLESASLAQIDVPYDDGKEEHVDLPGFGLHTASLSAAECTGSRLSYGEYRDGLCAEVVSTGLRYEWSDYDFGTGNHSMRGQCLELFTATPVDWYTYINAWSFCDDGEIQARVGAGGTLAPGHTSDPRTGTPIGKGQSRAAVNHYHNVFWRVNFSLTSQGGTPLIKQVDVAGDGAVRTTTESLIAHETAVDTAPSRSWEAVSSDLLNADDRPRAYDILIQNADPYRRADHPYTNHDLYVTEDNRCELLAAQNFHPPCGTEVDQFVNGEALKHPVLWIQSSFHHRPRDEDEPLMDEKWLSFELVPRGVSALNPLAPHSHG